MSVLSSLWAFLFHLFYNAAGLSIKHKFNLILRVNCACIQIYMYLSLRLQKDPLLLLFVACCSYLLVGLFALRAPGSRPAVMRLNDEGVFLLQLTVHQAAGPQLALTRRAVQHHCLERSLQPVDVERTDLP